MISGWVRFGDHRTEQAPRSPSQSAYDNAIWRRLPVCGQESLLRHGATCGGRGPRHPRAMHYYPCSTQSPHHGRCFRQGVSWSSPTYPRRPRLTAAPWNCLGPRTGTSAIPIGWTGGDDIQSKLSRELARSCCVAFAARHRLPASSSSRYFQSSRSTTAERVRGSLLCWTPLLVRGHVPRQTDPQQHARL